MLVLGAADGLSGGAARGLGHAPAADEIAVAAYAAYAINATQFVLKLRAARLQAAGSPAIAGLGRSLPA